jgi:hypothetical protein
MKKINFIKSIRLIKDESEAGLIALKAIGIAELSYLLSPSLISSLKNDNPHNDGIYELDFILDSSDKDYTSMEMEVNIVFRIKSLPAWVKGFKVNAKENSDIVLM